MPFGPFRRRRRVAFPVWITFATAAGLSCSAPDGSGLYEPFLGGGGGSGGGAGAGSGSGGSSAGVAAGGSTAGRNSEGQGGNLPLAGAAGAGEPGGGGEAGSSAPDAGSLDAGGERDAGPPDPPECEPSDEVCDGIDNDCDDVVDSAGACPEGCGGFTLADHAYIFCGEEVDRGIALTRCGAEGMKLAWIETPEENAALLTSIGALDVPVPAGQLRVQIGASDSDNEDEWIWVGNAAAFDGFQFWDGNSVDDGGEPVAGAYANWAALEPNDEPQEDCGVINLSGNADVAPGQWDDRDCQEELTFLCEEP
jgi:hypothetical protein